MVVFNTVRALSLPSAVRLIYRYWYVFVPFWLTAIFLFYVLWLFGSWLQVDTVSYFNVANYYATFQWDKAVNGYWSPLLSWLLVPAAWLRVDMTLWLRLLQGGMVLAVLGVMSIVHIRHQKIIPVADRSARIMFAVLYLAVGVTISYWAAKTSTPDFLSGVVAFFTGLSVYLWYRKPTIKLGITVGTLLGLLFFAKSVGAVAVCGITVWILWLSLCTRSARYRYVRSAIVILITTGLLLGGWSIAIFLKYNTWTLSTATPVNFSLNAPSVHGYQQIDYSNTILPLPYSDSSTPWDDPTYLIQKPWGVWQHISYYLKHTASTFTKFVWLFLTTSPLVLVSIWVFARERKRVLVWAVLTAIGAIAASYSLFNVEERYLYLVLVPLLCYSWLALSKRPPRGRLGRGIVIGLSLLSLMLVLGATISSQSSAYYMQGFRAAQQQLKGIIPKKSHAAVQSLEFMSVCYYLQIQCPALNYKLTNDTAGNRPLIDALRSQHITYYITQTAATSDDLKFVRLSVVPASRMCYSLRQGTFTCGGAHMFVYKLTSK